MLIGLIPVSLNISPVVCRSKKRKQDYSMNRIWKQGNWQGRMAKTEFCLRKVKNLGNFGIKKSTKLNMNFITFWLKSFNGI